MSTAVSHRHVVLLAIVLTGVIVVSAFGAVASNSSRSEAAVGQFSPGAVTANDQLLTGVNDSTTRTSDPAWPMAGANAAHTRHLETTGPTNPVTRRWRSTSIDAYQITEPAVADGTIYFGGTARVYAMDAWTGEQRWSFTTGKNTGPNSPAVFKNTVYVTTHNGQMFAIDRTTGKVFWEFKPGKPARAPVVADRTVYVSKGGGDGTLYALDALTGNEQWAIRPERGPSRVAVANGRVYFTGGKRDHRSMYSVNAKDGSRRWKVSIGSGGFAGTPTVANGIVFVGTQHGSVFAVDAETGDILWDRKFNGSGNIRPPAVADDAVYLATRKGAVHSVAAETGKLRWSTQLAGRDSAPAVVNGTVYVGHRRSISLLDAETGVKQATFTIDTPNARTASSPAVLNGSLYVGYGFGQARGGYNTTRMYALGTPDISYANISVSNRQVAVNETVTVSLRVTNTGSGPGGFNATLHADDILVVAEPGRVNAGGETTVTFNLNFTREGTHTVRVGGLSRKIAVGDVAPPSTPSVTPATPTSTTAITATTQTSPSTPTSTAPGFGIGILVTAFGLIVMLLYRSRN